MATLIKTTGEEIVISPGKSKHYKLKELQNYVGGCIETLPVATDQLMIINAEGKFMGLPVNLKATEIAFENCIFDTIVGDVIICFNHEIK